MSKRFGSRARRGARLKSVSLVAGGMLTASALGCAVISSLNAYAEDTGGVNFSVGVGSSLNVTLSADTVSLNLNPVNAQFATQTLKAGVRTNNPAGYTMTMASTGGATALTRTAAITDGTTPTIPTLAAEASESDAGFVNHWGYRFGDSGNFLPFTGELEYDTYDGATNLREKTISFASKVDTTQAPGTYELALTFSAVANPNVTYMQNWTGCSSMSIGETITLTDSRDNTQYLVGKLKRSSSDTGTTGGWCWMLENLALDIADSTVQGKMTSSTTNATDAQLGYLKNGGGSSPNTAYAVSKAWNSSNTTNYYDRPLINVDLINTVPSTKYGSASGKVGVYYNYCAASAGTYCYSSSSSSGSATADVCPAGWRLPTGASSGEFQTLYSAYGSNHTNFTTALSTPLSGYFYSGSAYNQGSNGYWWSSTRYNNANMYLLYVDASGVDPQYYSGRDGGFSIRCILK